MTRKSQATIRSRQKKNPRTAQSPRRVPPGSSAWDVRARRAIARLIRPDELNKHEQVFWSVGYGDELWDLFCACIAGDLGAVKKLLARDPALARAHYEYRTPLSFAVRENRLEVAAWLLDHGAAPFGVGGDLIRTAQDRGYAEMQAMLERRMAERHGASRKGERIAAAIRARDPAQVRALLDAEPDLLHAGDERSNRPIHWAVMTRQPGLIDELHARGADLEVQRGDGARPIQLTNGDYHFRGWRDVPKDSAPSPREIYEHLRARGAAVDLCTACHFGDLKRVRALLRKDPKLANRPSDYVTYYACSGTPLRNAAGGGHLEIVKLLLDKGADPNLPEEEIAPRGHALHAAVCNGHIEIVRLLLERGALPNVEIESSADTLSAALSRGNKPMVELLCSYGAARPVHLLAYSGDIQTAAAVFAANPEKADNPHALECAAGQGHEGFVRLMLRHKPKLAQRVAVGVRHRGPGDPVKTKSLTEHLFEQGMDPNFPSWLRITPLHRFAEFGDVENAAIFMAHGANPNLVDLEFQSTPLGWAARCGKARMVEWLLNHGANPALPAAPAWARPRAWAQTRGHAEVLRILDAFEASGRLPRRALEEYEALARDWQDAYATGEAGALKRLGDHFQFERDGEWDRRPLHERMQRLKRHARDRLLKHEPAAGASDTLTEDEARSLVARAHGYATWNELVRKSARV